MTGRAGRIVWTLACFGLGLCPGLGSSLAVAGEQGAAYRAGGIQAGLFDHYDNDGYSLAVSASPDGSVELRVRVFDAPLESSARLPAGKAPDGALPPAADRDTFARELVKGSASQAEAVRRVLLAVAGEVRYDPDRLRNQDPAAVFASRRAYCVGLAELSVDLLRRIGISARTVQGILRTDSTADRYEPSIGGVYHRWIEVFYPDRGYVFSDPGASINGVDARYIPFDRRSLTRPRSLQVTEVSAPQGALRYATVRAGDAVLRVREAR